MSSTSFGSTVGISGGGAAPGGATYGQDFGITAIDQYHRVRIDGMETNESRTAKRASYYPR